MSDGEGRKVMTGGGWLENGGRRVLAEHEGDDVRGGQGKRMKRVGRKEWSMGGGGSGA